MVVRLGIIFSVFFVAASCLPSRLAAQSVSGRIYELYNSTSTPRNYKSLLKSGIVRIEFKRPEDWKIVDGKPERSPLKFGAVYAVPNPAIGVKHPVVHVETGLVDGIEIKFFSPEGALIEEAVILEPVRMSSGVSVFEYKFASNDTPKGSCAYTVRAFRDGFAPIQVSGSIAFMNFSDYGRK